MAVTKQPSCHAHDTRCSAPVAAKAPNDHRHHDDSHADVAEGAMTLQDSVWGMTAALGGLDGVVFTGGIGINAPAVRARICGGLAYLGVRIDASRNASCISADDSAVRVETFSTDEELIIARHMRSLLDAQTATAKEA